MWHNRRSPEESGLVFLRGFDPLGTYAQAVLDWGAVSNEAFASDFGVGWTNQQIVLGEPLESLINATEPLLSDTVPKMVLGYPYRSDFNFRPGHRWMHQTGPFTRSFSEDFGRHFEMERFSTGGGNSGGPVFVQQNGNWIVGGIFVSGTQGRMARGGIFALDEEAHNLGTAAILKSEADDSGITLPEGEEFYADSTRPLLLRGGARRFVARPLVFRNIPTYLTNVRLALEIETPAIGNLHVFLRSPSGRVRPITVPDENFYDDEPDLSFDEEITDVFFGSNPNGAWRLFMRDTVRGSTSQFQSAYLSVTVR
jgi:hypothetical protein